MGDLGHLSHQIGDFEQSRRGVAPGDHDMLPTRPGQQCIDHLVYVDPPPSEWVGELVENVEVVFLRGEAALNWR